MIPLTAIAMTIADLFFFEGRHLQIIASWIHPLLEGIRTGGNIWGTGSP